MATIEKAQTIQGLSEKLASKLTFKGDKPRIFQLVQTGELDTFNHNVEAGIQGLEIKRGGTYPAQTTIYDKHETGSNKVKVIYNIIGRETRQNEKGESYTVDQYESITFDRNGQCIVQPGNKDKLARLLLSDNNGTNTERRTVDGSGANIPIIWEEVKDHTIEAQERRRLGELEDIARSAIKTMKMDDLKAMLVHFNKDYTFPGKQVDEMRWDLRQYADQNPHYFLSNSPDESVTIGLQIDDAIAYGVLEHDKGSRAYAMAGKAFFTYKMEEEEDPKAALVKHFINPKNKADKAQLIELLKND